MTTGGHAIDRYLGLLPSADPAPAPVLRLELVTGPVGGWGAFLTLAACKDHLRVNHDADDAEITAMRDAAARWCLTYQRTNGLIATYRARFAGFPGGHGGRCPLLLPLSARPSVVVASVLYDDENGTEQTLAASAYTVEAHAVPAAIRPGADGWPLTQAESDGYAGAANVRVTYTAGSADADGVASQNPELTYAVLVLLTHLYEHRSSTEPRIGEAAMAAVRSLLGMDRAAVV
jgi:uncharacterized phiE125 gp8 family phage protein